MHSVTRRRFAWLFTAVSLCLMLILVGQAANAFIAGHCECRHGQEVDCDCPHHSGGEHDDDLPPCHRKLKAQKKAETSDVPGFKAQCGASQASLVLFSPTTLPHLAEPVFAVLIQTLRFEVRSWPPETFSSPPRAPPRVSAVVL